jgi:NAD(P)H dehydrogenase (quinone)
MNILIVKAHPSPSSHTNRIAETYANAKKDKKHDVKIVDLYAKEYETCYLTFDNIREMVPPPTQKIFEEQITWADEIVVVHPIWWGMPPAIMKNWIDLTFWVHFAYKYSPDGKVITMLNGKTAKIFATCGGTGWWYYLPIMPLASYWKLCVFGFTGVDVVDMKICTNLDKWRGERADKHFEKFLRRIKTSA